MVHGVCCLFYFTLPAAQAKSAFSLGVLPQVPQNDEGGDIRKRGRGKYNHEQGTKRRRKQINEGVLQVTNWNLMNFS